MVGYRNISHVLHNIRLNTGYLAFYIRLDGSQTWKIPDIRSILNLTFNQIVSQKNGLIKQLLRDVDWGGLDLLLVDTPPGSLSRYARPDEPATLKKFEDPDLNPISNHGVENADLNPVQLNMIMITFL